MSAILNIMLETGTIIKTFTSEKGNEIIIRYPKWEDLDEMWRYANELSAEDTFISLSGENLSKDEEITHLAKVLSEMEKRNVSHLFVFVNKTMIGSSHVMRRGKRNEHIGRIGISIGKEYREEGIGSVLFEATLEEAKKLGFVLVDLKVYGNNTRAYNMYKKFGFLEIGRGLGMVRYKENFEDEIWMYKKLELL